MPQATYTVIQAWIKNTQTVLNSVLSNAVAQIHLIVLSINLLLYNLIKICCFACCGCATTAGLMQFGAGALLLLNLPVFANVVMTQVAPSIEKSKFVTPTTS